MKDIVKAFLHQAANPPSMVEGIRDLVALALETALDVSFSESEAVIITHAILGVLSARGCQREIPGESSRKVVSTEASTRKPFSSFFDDLKDLDNKMEDDDSSTNSTADDDDSSSAACHERHQVVVASQDFPLMELDGHSILSAVLTYLPYEDLNSLAVCCRRLRDLRADESLDQTRSATLTFSSTKRTGNGLVRLAHAVRHYDLPSVLQNRRSTLRLKGFTEVLDDDTLETEFSDDIILPGVISLDLSHEKIPDNPYIKISKTFYSGAFGRLLPNVEILDVSYADEITMICNLEDSFPGLRVLSANESGMEIFLEGSVLRRWQSLRELNVQGQKLYKDSSMRYGLPPHIERLDIRYLRGYLDDNVKNSDIMDLLRHTPTLRWLRCDASKKDLVLMKQERPDVTIVNF